MHEKYDTLVLRNILGDGRSFMRSTEVKHLFKKVNWGKIVTIAPVVTLGTFILFKILGANNGASLLGTVVTAIGTIGSLVTTERTKRWIIGINILFVVVIGIHSLTSNPSFQPETIDVEQELPVPVPEEISPAIPESPPSETEVNEAVQFLTPDQVEQELLTGTNSYLPEIEPLDTQHLFLMSTHMTNLETDAEMRSEQTRLFVYERYKNFLHEKENFSAAAVNGNPELSHLILSAEQYDLLVRERIATYDSPVEPYEELIRIYEEACAAAPRGEFFLQLARPYSEIILYIPRETQSEKDLLFSYGSQAVHAFLETLTYQNISAESDADILYRIGAVYHTLGDTSGLTQDARLELYQLAGAFLENAASLVTPEDSSYGYAPYYCGVVMHKLAITVSEPTHKLFFLTKAHDYYVSALDVGSFNRVTETAILNALENVEYRSAFLTK